MSAESERDDAPPVRDGARTGAAPDRGAGAAPAGRPRRWRRRLGCTLLVLLLAPVLLYVTRGFVLHPLLARGAGAAGPWLGLELSVGRVRGDWWNTLELEDVRAVATDEDAPLRALAWRRLAVRLAARELLRGNLAGVRGVALEGLRLEVDATRGAEPDPDAPAEWPALPDALPAVELRDAEVTVRLAQGRLDVRGAELDVAPGDAGAEPGDVVEGRVGNLAWEPAAGVPLELGLGLRARYAAGRIHLERLDAGPVHVEEGSTVDLGGLAARRVAWDVSLRALGGSLRTDGELADDRLVARLDGEGFDAGRVAFWWPELEAEQLGGTVALAGEVALALAGDAGPTASARVDWTRPTWRGREADTVAAEAELEGADLRVPSLELVQGPNLLRAVDARVDLGAPDLAALVGGASARLEARVRDLARLAPLEDAPPHDVELVASLAPDGLRVESGFVETVGGRLDVVRGRVGWNVATDAVDWDVELDARARFGDLAPLGELLGQSGWSGSLAGDVRVGGTVGEPTWDAALDGVDVRIADRALGQVRLAASGDERSLRLGQLLVDGEDARATGSGRVVLAPLAFEDLLLEGELRRLSGWSPALESFLGEADVVAFEADLDGSLRALDGTASLRGESLRAAGEDLGPWSLDVRAAGGAFQVESSRLETPWGQLDLAASCADLFAQQFEARVDALRLAAGDDELALEAPARIALTDAGPRVEALRLVGTAGELEVAVTPADGGVSVVARAAGLRVQPFAAPELPPGFTLGPLDLELEASGLGGAPRVRARGALADLAWAGLDGHAWRATWDAVLADRVLALERLELAEGDDVALSLAGELPLDLAAGGAAVLADGPLRLEGALDWPSLGELWPAELDWRADGAASARLALAGAWSALSGSLAVEASGSLRTPEGEDLATAVQLNLELGDEGLLVRESLARIGALASVSLDGRLGSPLDLRSLLEVGPAPLRSAPLELATVVEDVDLEWLGQRVQALRRTDGAASGALRISGSIDEPELHGRLTLADGELRIRGQVPPLTAIQAELAFDGRRVQIERGTAELGAAPVGVAGSIDLGVDPPVLDLRLTGENALLARSRNLRLRADLDLAVTDTLAAPTIAGTVRLRNTRMRVDVDFVEIVQSSEPSGPGGLQLFSLRDPPLSNARFDVRVLTEEPVDLRGNLMRGELRTDLRVQGTGEVPLPVGSVFLDAFLVSLPGGRMRFDVGLVEFQRGNPFDPELVLRGESKLFGYDVTMTVQGELSAPEVVFTSSPKLENAELAVMVLTGQPPGGANMQEAGANLAVYFGRSLLSSGGGLDDDSLLDRVDVQVGREVSAGGTPTTEATLRVADDLAGPRSQLLLLGEQDVYEDINMGLRLRFVLR